MFGKICAPVLLVIFLLTTCSVSAQDTDKMRKLEDSMLVMADSMYHAFIPDERPEYTEKFVRQLVNALKQPNSWDYDFPKLKEVINIIYPDDRAFRIFNWAIAPTEITRRYYGAIQMPGETLKLHPLIDHSGELAKCGEDTVLSGGRWYGGLIYKIMTHEVDGNPVYTLFALNAANPISNKKFLDPMTITEKGVVFGAPMFEVNSTCRPGELVNRFILEYKKDVQVSMNWDAEFNAIYFDKLVSQVNDPNRKYTYVPSGQYDGFRWKGRRWTYVENLIPIEIREDGQAPAPSPSKTGEKKK